ncbi:MAG: hypothetical protein HY298_08210 [Verrucomicrobia bacterium]|nr:hypothetical protein [Verrucomicrobiota bacterium]
MRRDNQQTQHWSSAFRLLWARSTLKRELQHHLTHHASRITFSICAGCLSLTAAEIDPTKLPPSAKLQVEFDRDIKPIFEKSCLRCHGPEKPKSHFRLDNREAALQGGDNNKDDIIPGDSVKSRLIQNVARLVEDMEMPPPGKGEPLNPAQIGLLRAWIDQGASWPEPFPVEERSFVFAPTLRWIHVEGNEKKFRENEGMKEGWATGIEEFQLKEQLDNGRTFTARGRALFQDQDYQLNLKLEKREVGFISGGFEQWRKYYDDTGAYYRPFQAKPSYDLDRNLFLDTGRAWIDFGLTLPDWPQMVLGYEYQFKEGTKSTLQWGDVNGKNIYPAAKDIDEHTHILKFDLTQEYRDWRIEDNARVEIYDSRTRRDNVNSFSSGPGPDSVVSTREGFEHTQGMNALRLERQVNDWLFLSGGYLYSRLDGSASLNQMTVDAAGTPVMGNLTHGGFWSSEEILLQRETHIVSLGGSLLPLEGFTTSLGLQTEWTQQEGFGNVNLDEGDPYQPDNFVHPATLRSDLDKQKLSGELSLRFSKIPWTVLFAEARIDHESIGQFERELGQQEDQFGPLDSAFLRDTDFTNLSGDYRFGFNTSPWRWLSLSAHYRIQASDSDYDHRLDFSDPPTNSIPNEGYSAFIRNRKIDGDEVQTKLALKPAKWLKTTFTYKLLSTDYHTTTDPVSTTTAVPGGGIQAGNYDAHVYSVNAALTPFQRLYLATTFSYSDTRTLTAQLSEPSVVPYRGDVYTIISSATFALDKSTDLNAAYSFSQANYDQNNYAYGLPLGLNYARHGVIAGVTRRLTSNLTTNVRYAYYRYDEPSSGGVNNYAAHGVFATLTMRWP